MTKRYQVFVSSTYKDLKEERQHVMFQLLKMDCFPAGMELFPAANSKPKEVIMKVIDDCDYYVLIVGGRYGTVLEDGKSWTWWEYEYAKNKGIPIIPLVRRNQNDAPNGCPVETGELKEKLNEFRELLRQETWFNEWNDANKLVSCLTTSWYKARDKYPAVGWVRGNQSGSQNLVIDNAKLKKLLEDLTNEPPPGVKHLSQGDDPVTVRYRYTCTRRPSGRIKSQSQCSDKCTLTWNRIFERVSPVMLTGASERDMHYCVDSLVKDSVHVALRQKHPETSIDHIFAEDSDFQRIKIQLRSLKLIDLASDESQGELGPNWKLTEYGEKVMERLVNRLRI